MRLQAARATIRRAPTDVCGEHMVVYLGKAGTNLSTVAPCR